MALNIANTILSGYNLGSSESFKAVYSPTAKEILKIDTTGRNIHPNNPGFIAGSTTNAWTSPNIIASWSNYITGWTGTYTNIGNGFSVANSRFVAPTAGNYLFIANMYIYSANSSGYMHPVFGVNGSVVGRAAAGADGNLRIRGYAFSYHDAQIEDVLKLQVGDYVDVRTYCNNATMQYYPLYSYFAGWLIG